MNTILFWIWAFFLSIAFLAHHNDCKADEIYTYDENGVYDGSIDDYGNQYDGNGTYKGIVDIMGNVYNQDGTWQGYIHFSKETGPRPVYIIPGDK